MDAPLPGGGHNMDAARAQCVKHVQLRRWELCEMIRASLDANADLAAASAEAVA